MTELICDNCDCIFLGDIWTNCPECFSADISPMEMCACGELCKKGSTCHTECKNCKGDGCKECRYSGARES